ncbi:hypothetical protein V5799_021957 [Amblyomma americanum]|uniref:Uncharacterized protein n=1 Tax=Amblyomma americanum TaxID=6943 RepID=A0AAQ4FLX9_AMBAM
MIAALAPRAGCLSFVETAVKEFPLMVFGCCAVPKQMKNETENIDKKRATKRVVRGRIASDISQLPFVRSSLVSC